jgi:hypothetical protein
MAGRIAWYFELENLLIADAYEGNFEIRLYRISQMDIGLHSKKDTAYIEEYLTKSATELTDSLFDKIVKYCEIISGLPRA